jgi:hypothetical protein
MTVNPERAERRERRVEADRHPMAHLHFCVGCTRHESAMLRQELTVNWQRFCGMREDDVWTEDTVIRVQLDGGVAN